MSKDNDAALLEALAKAAVRAADAGNSNEAARLTNAYIRLRRVGLRSPENQKP